jgi:hypothetical protein
MWSTLPGQSVSKKSTVYENRKKCAKSSSHNAYNSFSLSLFDSFSSHKISGLSLKSSTHQSTIAFSHYVKKVSRELIFWTA